MGSYTVMPEINFNAQRYVTVKWTVCVGSVSGPCQVCIRSVSGLC